jgi:hypothetical protein
VRQKFTSAILPPYVRRSPRVESVLPLLYLHGLSSGDFREALPALLGPEAVGLSSSAILRLTKAWTAEYEAFRCRDLAARDYVYLWADRCTSPSAWRRSGSVRWSSSACGPTGRRKSWPSRTAIGRAPRAGARCCETSSAAGCGPPCWRLGTGAGVLGGRARRLA